MAKRERRQRRKYVMISTVAERFDIHPQTLRLYEREGLLTPARSAGNTRLYDEESLRRLETILFLTRELGVNLAGVEVVLTLRQQLEQMQREMDRLLAAVQQQVRDQRSGVRREHALVRLEGGPLRRIG
ncbi:MAG TPA: MerR family transcriptional regulator [Thermoanaerobaculia bacterium]|nr:MerR family transcriptional regulator [Thermoanaerobaculia bacterium]